MMGGDAGGIERRVPDSVWFGVPDGPNGTVPSTEIEQVEDHQLRMGLEIQLDDCLEARRYFTIPMTDKTGAVYRTIKVRKLPLQLMVPE